MKIVHSANDLQKPAGKKVCLAIGFFDGVHLGHQQIIRQTIADARQHGAMSLVITFDRHPNTIVAPGRVPPLIYSLPQKLRVIESLGPDALLLIHFDKALSEESGEVFIRELARELFPIQSLCVGANFHFGHKRSGDVSLLKKLGAELKFAVHGMAAVALDNQPVSSTRIRETVLGGDLDGASQMLGRAYSLSGEVVRGKRLGHELGFPTANIATPGLLLPSNGVYAVNAKVITPCPAMPEQAFPVSDAAHADSIYHGLVNIGIRPTLEESIQQRTVETHLLDFSADLYGQDLEIIFLEKLREEKKFADLAQLKRQIASDIESARSLF